MTQNQLQLFNTIQ